MQMKRKFARRLPLLALVLALWLAAHHAALADAPYLTFTRGPNGWSAATPTAYEPDGMIRIGLNQPSDIFYDDASGMMYIADTGNSRIAVYDGSGVRQSIGEGVLANPVGVYAAGGRIYAADSGLREIVVFDAAGKLLQRIGRPEEPIYGKNNDFVPKKVAVDKRGNIYVISEGAINGVVQLAKDGRFLGYVGANDTQVSLKMLIQRLLFTDAQKGQLFRSTPPSPTSLVLDKQGLLYTVTEGVRAEGIKKLNILGSNILDTNSWVSDSLIDIDVDAEGNIYTVDSSGWIDIYDSFGNLLFDFGGPDGKYERAGFVKNPSAIDAADSGRMLYVADKDRGVINRYRITPFAEKVFEGAAHYKRGKYVESEPIWQEVLRMNSFFILSHQALAKAYFKQDQHGRALASFRLAEDKTGYSDAFWNIRNEWLQNNLLTVIIVLAALLPARAAVLALDRRYGVLQPAVRLRRSLAERKLAQELRFMFHFLRHPIDAVQELKENKRATVRSATILYGWLLILQVILVYARGYLFAGVDPDRIGLLPILLATAVPLAFWVVLNYMVSTVGEGEGRFSEVYISTIYALSPYLLFALPIALISNVLTYNEAFIYDYSMAIIQGWSALLVCITVKELHDFTFLQTVRNLFLTVFAIVLAALVLFLLVLLFNQEVEFIQSIIQELRNRART
jgi:DNA-binding beta-propeller fold protein YncE